MIERLDAQSRVFAILSDRHVRVHLPAVGEVGVIDLQQKPGIDDKLVFVRHGVGDRISKFLRIEPERLGRTDTSHGRLRQFWMQRHLASGESLRIDPAEQNVGVGHGGL